MFSKNTRDEEKESLLNFTFPPPIFTAGLLLLQWSREYAQSMIALGKIFHQVNDTDRRDLQTKRNLVLPVSTSRPGTDRQTPRGEGSASSSRKINVRQQEATLPWQVRNNLWPQKSTLIPCKETEMTPESVGSLASQQLGQQDEQ